MGLPRTPRTFVTFHLKDLLSLGLTKSRIMNIVQKADVFRDIPRQQGYAIDYTFNQAVLLHVGGALSKLGVSFRHVNRILIDLAGLDFEKNRERIVRDRLVIFVFSAALSKEDAGRLKGLRARIAWKSPGTGRSMPRAGPVRMASLTLKLLRENDAPRIALDDYVRVSLHRIVRSVAGLSPGPTPARGC